MIIIEMNYFYLEIAAFIEQINRRERKYASINSVFTLIDKLFNYFKVHQYKCRYNRKTELI